MNIQKFLDAIQSRNLKWDLLKEAQELSSDPVKFRKFIKRYHSKEVYQILYKNKKIKDLPLHITTSDTWMRFMCEWKLSGN
jgi:hypothetical protein